ncbi:MAG TPA: hypothetical protein VHB79_05055 [Polyangiaceae bacterium]|nr:hypothetical protein [Polyangiaceae bacterium]
MTLVVSRSLSVTACALLLVALSGCGDPFAEFTPPAAGAGGVESGDAGNGPSITAPRGGTSFYTPSGGSTASGGGGLAAAGAVATGGSEAMVPSVGGEGGAADQPLLGSAGAPTTNMPVMALDLIDDVEGDFPSLPLRAGRNGGWFSVHDDTSGQMGAVSPLSLQPARGTSHFAVGVSGGGFTDWGAQMGVNLRSPYAAYDASKYCGLRFLAKGGGNGWAVLISDRLSVPDGGVCDDVNWASDNGCYQFVGRGLAVGNVWQEVVIRFDELRLMRNPASPRRLETKSLYDILFNFSSADGSGFELMIDDLSFIKIGSLACQ